MEQHAGIVVINHVIAKPFALLHMKFDFKLYFKIRLRDYIQYLYSILIKILNFLVNHVLPYVSALFEEEENPLGEFPAFSNQILIIRRTT